VSDPDELRADNRQGKGEEAASNVHHSLSPSSKSPTFPRLLLPPSSYPQHSITNQLFVTRAQTALKAYLPPITAWRPSSAMSNLSQAAAYLRSCMPRRAQSHPAGPTDRHRPARMSALVGANGPRGRDRPLGTPSALRWRPSACAEAATSTHHQSSRARPITRPPAIRAPDRSEINGERYTSVIDPSSPPLCHLGLARRPTIPAPKNWALGGPSAAVLDRIQRRTRRPRPSDRASRNNTAVPCPARLG